MEVQKGEWKIDYWKWVSWIVRPIIFYYCFPLLWLTFAYQGGHLNDFFDLGIWIFGYLAVYRSLLSFTHPPRYMRVIPEPEEEKNEIQD